MSSRGRPAVPPDWDAFRRSLPLAVGLGAVLFVLVTVLDVVFAPFTGLESVEPVGEAAALQDLLASIPMRLLYGGITEEILLRWASWPRSHSSAGGFETGSGSARRRRPQR